MPVKKYCRESITFPPVMKECSKQKQRGYNNMIRLATTRAAAAAAPTTATAPAAKPSTRGQEIREEFRISLCLLGHRHSHGGYRLRYGRAGARFETTAMEELDVSTTLGIS